MDFRWSHWPSICIDHSAEDRLKRDLILGKFIVIDHSLGLGNRLEAMPSKPCPSFQAFLDALPKGFTSKQWDAFSLYSFKDKR